MSALVLLAACGSEAPVAGGDEPGAGDLEGDSFEAAPEPALLGAEALAAVGADLDTVLTQSSIAGTSQSVLVVDLESGQRIYEKNPDALLIPASNTKIFTSAAAMLALGADHRFVTRAYQTQAGDLVVIAHHDFTGSTYFYPKPELPLDRLAEAIYAAGVRNVSGDLLLAGEMLFQGYNFGSYDAINARSTAAVQLEGALNRRGIATGVLGATPSFEPPAGATLIAEVASAPLSVAFVPLNVVSHNEFADITMRHIGFELAGTSSYASGEEEVLAAVGSVGVDVSGLALKDGSGLSRQNRLSASAIASLISHVAASRQGEAWLRTLSIAGVRGTLGNRMGGADTAGRFFGKTGTLTGVIATSGLLYHRHDGRRYAVSVLMNEVGSAASARAAQDQVTQVVARDIRGTAALPAPTLLAARNDRSNLVDFQWTSVEGADGYVLWLSRDGVAFSRAEARFVRKASHRAEAIADGMIYARVTAYSATRGESEPSDTYAVTSSRTASRVLLVDGNDRYQADPAIENPAGRGHDFARVYGEALADYGLDTAANEEIAKGTVDLADYEAVVWMLGEESTAHETLDTAEQRALIAYLAQGGKLLISGAEIGWDLVAQGDAMDAAFYREVLKSDYLADSSGSYAALSPEGGRVDFYNPGVLDVAFADVLAPVGEAREFLSYDGGGTAAVYYDGDDYRLINVGFPIETIDSDDAATRFVTEAAQALGL